MSRALRMPAAHFLVAGGLLFALRVWWLPAPLERERPRVVLTAADVGRLRAEWSVQHGVAPDAETERVLVDDALDEEILYREAVAAGLDRQDPLVRARLLKLARFLGDASEDGDDAVEREARRLDLASHDVVTRRHLTQVMRLMLSHVGPADMPDESALRGYFDDHADSFHHAPLVRLTHVFLGRERHGDALARDAGRLLEDLRRSGAVPETAPDRGDVFLRGAHPPLANAEAVDRIFGSGFAAAIRDAPIAEWVGPIASSYGLHLVWIHERTDARLPSLDAVRSQVAHGVLEAAGRERLRDALARLRARYDLRVAR